jgi:hypothetical protein
MITTQRIMSVFTVVGCCLFGYFLTKSLSSKKQLYETPYKKQFKDLLKYTYTSLLTSNTKLPLVVLDKAYYSFCFMLWLVKRETWLQRKMKGAWEK